MMLPMKLVTHTSFEVLAQTALRKLKGGGRAISTADHAPPSQWSAARVPTAQASSSERLQTPWRLLLPAGVGLRDHPFPSQWRTSIPCASKAPTAQTWSLPLPESASMVWFVPLSTGSHWDPSQCARVPEVPAAQTSSAEFPRTPKASSKPGGL